jgi:hypothetical protein
LTDWAEPRIDRDVIMPTVVQWLDLPATAAPLALAPGLSVTLGIDNLIRIDNSFVKAAAAPVTAAQLPDVPLPDGEIVAGWYLQPLEAKAADGRKIPFSIENTWGGEAGDVYRVYTGQYSWKLRGEFTLGSGPLAGEDLGDLSSLLVVRVTN